MLEPYLPRLSISRELYKYTCYQHFELSVVHTKGFRADNKARLIFLKSSFGYKRNTFPYSYLCIDNTDYQCNFFISIFNVHSCSKVMGFFFAVAKYGVYF